MRTLAVTTVILLTGVVLFAQDVQKPVIDAPIVKLIASDQVSVTDGQSSEITTEIVGPNAESTGNQVVLQVKPLLNKPKDLKSVIYKWDVVPSNNYWRAVENNNTVFFATREPGTYNFRLSASYLWVSEGTERTVRHTLSTTTHVVVLNDANHGPVNPTPVNPVNPTPVNPTPLPAGKFGMATLARQWALESVDLSTNSKIESAKKLAAAYREVSNKIANKELPRADDSERWELQLLNAIADAINASLSDQKDQWRPWGNLWRDKAYELYKSQRLQTTADMQTLFNEVATGLEALR